LNLIIDIGNTIAKVALFEGTEPVESLSLPNGTLEGLGAFCANRPIERGIVATVVDLDEQALARLEALPFPLLWLNHHTPLPITNLYETPQTLGYDRIAAAVGAHEQFPHHNLLVIDAGTCITYEFVDASGRYQGGNISPGMQMRFKALHQFTGRLPLIESEGRLLPMGRDTDTAIRAGVLKGMEYEISGYIAAMKLKYPDLLIFLTGGDGFSFDSSIKSIIFADRFLVSKGLNRILNYNNGRI
jgi:type III pantothenate kinase